MKLSIAQIGELCRCWIAVQDAKGDVLRSLAAFGELSRAMDPVVCGGWLGWLNRAPSSMTPGEFMRAAAAWLPALRSANAGLANLHIDMAAFDATLAAIVEADKANA